MDASLKIRLRNNQILTFGLLWTAYASYYIGRVNMNVAQNGIMADFGWSKTLIGTMLSIYTVFYAIGQVVNGQIGDKLGARKLMFVSLMVAIICNFLFGFTSSFIVMCVIWSINGYFQSTGWSLLIKTASCWYPKKIRGTVTGFLSTCYQMGHVLSWLLAGAVISWAFWKDSFGVSSWRGTFWVPALILLPIAILFVVFMRNKPQDVGLPAVDVDEASGPPPKADEMGKTPQVSETLSFKETIRLTFTNRILWTLAGGHFFNNMIRYSFMNWAVTYMIEYHKAPLGKGAFTATILPFAGSLGAITAGYVTDKYLKSRRTPLCAVMLLILAGICLIFPTIPMGSWLMGTIMLGLAGFMIYGPDMLMSGAAVMDFGHPKAKASATGFIMGAGALGAVFSGGPVGWILDKYGWAAGMYTWAGLAIVAAILMFTLWNAKPQEASK